MGNNSSVPTDTVHAKSLESLARSSGTWIASKAGIDSIAGGQPPALSTKGSSPMKKLLAALVAFSFLASPVLADEAKKEEPAKTEKKAAKKKAHKKAAKKVEEKKAEEKK